MTMNENNPGLGHNKPPKEEDLLRDNLSKRYDELLALYQETINGQEEIPSEINDDDSAGIVSDYIKDIIALKKSLESSRSNEKAPHLLRGKVIDSFFKKKTDVLDKIREEVEEPLADYLKRKEDEKRREIEEKALLAKEEAERKLREVQERERQAKEAEEKARKEKEEAIRKAEEERIRIEKERAEERARAEKEAEEIRRKAEEERKRIEEDRKREEEARRQKELFDQEQREKEEAERKEREELQRKEAEKAVLEAERKARERIEEAEKREKEKERELKSLLKEQEERIKQAERVAKLAKRESNKAIDDANRTTKAAAKLEKKTLAKSAQLSRTRGDGSMAAVSEKWIGSVSNRDELDLEALREHIPFDALEKAVQSYVNAGGRDLKGAFIYVENKTMVR